MEFVRRNTCRSRAGRGALLQEGKQSTWLFERFVMEGIERADELAKYGAVLDGAEMPQIRASTFIQKREEVYSVFHYAASFHCFVDEWHDCEELKPKPQEVVLCEQKKKERRRNIARSGVRLTSTYRCM